MSATTAYNQAVEAVLDQHGDFPDTEEGKEAAQAAAKSARDQVDGALTALLCRELGVAVPEEGSDDGS